MMEMRETLSAESVSTMHENSWDSFTYIIFESAEVAVVKHAGVVVSQDERAGLFG